MTNEDNLHSGIVYSIVCMSNYGQIKIICRISYREHLPFPYKLLLCRCVIPGRGKSSIIIFVGIVNR